MLDFVGGIRIEGAKINGSGVHSETRVLLLLLLLLIGSGGVNVRSMGCSRVCGCRMWGEVGGEMGRTRVGRERSGEHLCGIKWNDI
jgi:hypothetical protein